MEINSDGIIRADIMTARIEDKNLLTKKGDVYVGTGVTTSYDGTDVYQTKAMNIQAAITEDVQRENGSHSLNLGAETFNGVNAISLGYNSNVSAANAVQIGDGTNDVANSLKFRNRTVVNGSDEIVGDYPLGFTKRVMEWPGDTWPKSHVDLTNGTVVTDWAFITDNGYKSEIAFVSIFNQKDDRADLNLVIDGNVYVDDGKRKVYAKGDVIDQAEKANNTETLNCVQLSNKNQLIDEKGSIKINGCVSFAVGGTDIELDNERKIPAWSKGIIVGSSDLAIIYTSNNKSGCLYYNSTGKNWVFVIPDTATNATNAINALKATDATNAEKTSFSNEGFTGLSPTSLKLDSSGTYQFYYAPLGFSCLLYFQLFVADYCSPIFTAPETIVATDGNTGISKGQRFIMKIKKSGEVVWLAAFPSAVAAIDNWIEFNPSNENASVYYRKIR